MTPDRELLEAFARTRSEAAFRELVDRHLGLVHAVARRVTRNDDLARDVAQAVFTKLASTPGAAPANLNLLSWLHRTARHKAIDLVRAENRRRRREEAVLGDADPPAAMNAPEPGWSDLEPVLDEALSKLREADRTLVLARFYQDRTHASTAASLGISEDAARVRTARALEKLRRVLARRGITTTADALAVVLAAHGVTAAPPALAATVASSAVAATAAGSATAATFSTTLAAMTKSQIAAVTTVAVTVPIIAYQFTENARLAREAERLRGLAAAGLNPPHRSSAPDSAVGATPRSSGPSRAGGGSAGEADGGDPGPVVAARSLREILAVSDPVARIQALFGYVAELGPGQLEPAIRELREGAPTWDPEGRMLVHMLLTRWAQEDPDAAFASLSGLDFKRLGGEATSILASLAAQDPARAAAWLDDPENALVHFPKMGHILAGTVAKEWVRQDPGAALEWAQRLPDGWRAGAYTGVLGSLATSDPESASRLALQLDPGDDRAYAIGQVAESWARRSPEAAVAWAETLEGGERRRAVSQALRSWAESRPSEAAAYLETLDDPAAADGHLASVADVWSVQDPMEAASWLSARPEGDGKTDAMGRVLWNWTTIDPQAASTWLAGQPEGPSRDRGIGALAKATFDSDPAAAISWAAEISDEEMRAGAVEIGIREWRKRDPEAAAAWLGEDAPASRRQPGTTIPSGE